MTLQEMIEAANRALHNGDEELAVLWMNILRETARAQSGNPPAETDKIEIARKVIQALADETTRH